MLNSPLSCTIPREARAPSTSAAVSVMPHPTWWARCWGWCVREKEKEREREIESENQGDRTHIRKIVTII